MNCAPTYSARIHGTHASELWWHNLRFILYNWDCMPGDGGECRDQGVSMRGRQRVGAALGTIFGLGALFAVAAMVPGLAGQPTAPRAAVAAPVARDGVSAA